MQYSNIWRVFLLAPLFYACQSEEILPEQTQPEIPVHKTIKVRASVPSDDVTSRAQITYGNPNEDYETFMWNEEDWFNLINITRLSDCPFGLQLEEVGIYNDGKTADFESYSKVDSSFVIKKGDILLAVYGEITREYKKDENGNGVKDENGKFLFDERNIITIGLGAEANKPQYIARTPAVDSCLSFMKDNLKMYAIVTAEKDDVVPDLYFKHLSAIMRVTVHNKSGNDVYPTKMEFHYPETQSFYNTTLYVSVDTTSADYGLIAYTSDDLYKGSDPFTSDIGTTINGKSGTYDTGESILAGETYDLYMSAIPIFNNDKKGSSLTIDLIANHITENPYSLTIDGFDKVIKPGLRYWFDVTLLPDNNMVLTKSLQTEANE